MASREGKNEFVLDFAMKTMKVRRTTTLFTK